jgi:hypothetical protein
VKKNPALYIIILLSVIFCAAGKPGNSLSKNTSPDFKLEIQKGGKELPHQELNFSRPIQVHGTWSSNQFSFLHFLEPAASDYHGRVSSIISQNNQISQDESSCSILILIFPFHIFW